MRRLKFILIGTGLLFLIAGGKMNAGESQNGKVKIYNFRTKQVEEVAKVIRTDAEWKKILTPEQFRVTRLKDTEKPFSGQCDVPQEKGVYQCVCCGTDLFSVGEEFASGTGWPSFWNPVSELNIITQKDHSFGMERIELLCKRCNAHLGHLFDDGPPPTGKRYCINSLSLKFRAEEAKKFEKATFAAGCFWGVEDAYMTLKGVVSTHVGYTGGTFKTPSYEDVCSNKTGHAEAVEIEFDPSIISFEELLDFFWKIHDPTTLNRQGPDVGTQYRSSIFYHNETQKKSALKSKEKEENSGEYKNKIVTEIVPAQAFYKAEEYHQQYFKKRGMAGCHFIPEKKKKQK